MAIVLGVDDTEVGIDIVGFVVRISEDSLATLGTL